MLIGDGVNSVQYYPNSVLLETVDFGPGCPIVIRAFVEVGAAEHSCVCTGGTKQPSIFDGFQRGFEEGDH